MTGKPKTQQRPAPQQEIVAFGRLIRLLRTERDLSQEALAERCDSAQVYISELERGLKEPCLKMIFKLANAFRMQPAELMSRVEDGLRK